MKTFKDFKEGVNRAQQAAIAISKKKSGKYDKDGKKIKEQQGPCWDGYKQVGMKKKGNKMVPNCVPVDEVAQDKDIKDKEGTQPAKYYAGDMAKSTKDKRAAHFAKKKSGPAPGDASAKTKTSKHTKKYKQMFGEAVSKFMTGDVEIKGKRVKVEVEVTGVDNKQRIYHANVLAPKEHFGLELKIPARVMHRGKWIKTKTGKAFEHLGEEIEGLKNKAEKSGMPYGILKKVYDRGMAAYKTGHRPGTTAQQWAFARVNSFVTKSKGTWGGADKDLAAKVRG